MPQMIQNLYYLFTLMVLLIPLVGFAWMLIRQRNLLKPFGLGSLSFVVSQVLLRLPLLYFVFAPNPWFIAFTYAYPVLYLIGLSFSAGLFEEWGRYMFMWINRQPLSRTDIMAFGLGHGGIEALLFVGIPFIQNPSTFASIEGFYGGVERLAAMALHIALTFLVYQGYVDRKHQWVWAALMLHGAINFGILMMVQMGVSLLLTELIFLGLAVLFLERMIKLNEPTRMA